MKYVSVYLFALAIGAYGCAGEQHPAADQPPHSEPAGGEHHHGEHGKDGHHEHEMKGPIGDLHSVLAPIWHDKSPERLTKACDQAKTMRDKSAVVETAPAPEGADAAAVTASAKEMTAAADALMAACAANGRPDVEAKFSAFHDAFHKTMEKAGAGHHPHHD